MRALALLLTALIAVGCEFQQQRGNYNPMEEKGAETKANTASAETGEAVEEEEFQLMDAYGEDDLNAISGFVEWNVAIDALKDSLSKAGHARQQIKTAPLFGGIALFTSENSAYWYKEEVLYTANPYAVAYSPDLPKAPPEVTHEAITQAIKKRERAKRDSSGNIEITREDRIEAAFGEFIALVRYANSKIDGANYTTEFLDEVEIPLTMETMISTINKFNEVLDTVASEHPEVYKGLKMDQSQLLYTYGRITNGMTVEQVTSLLGAEGEEFDTVSTSTGNYAAYSWRGFAGANLFIFFREGTVYNKVATGLV